MSKPNPPISEPLSDEEILVKHIFRGSSFAVVRLEEINEIGNLKADGVACYRPVNAQELFAVEHIALCQQKILRGARLEAGLFTTALDYCIERGGRPFRLMSESLAGDGDIEITRAQNRNFAAGEGVRIMVNESEIWSILLRYQVHAERQYRRAVEDFDRLRRLRPNMPNHPNIGAGPDVLDDILPLEEINPSICSDRQPVETEPSVSPFEPTPENNASAPESFAPKDRAPLAPAACALKTPPPTQRTGGHSVRRCAQFEISRASFPEFGQFKVEPEIGFSKFERDAGRLNLKPLGSVRRPTAFTAKAVPGRPRKSGSRLCSHLPRWNEKAGLQTGLAVKLAQ